MTDLPQLHEFRIELTDDGIVHLIFDAPDRTMNVFSNRAIHEAEAFADWLRTSDAKGVVISSGKSNAFCAGADLSELSTAYDMIMSTPKAQRDQVTVEHFRPIGRAFRKLETAGKPVAVAIGGLALGGGCELALAAHYRVMTDSEGTQIGLPESLVGLLPGGGGTQRLPRLVGVETSLPILLDGARFTAAEALAAGAADAVVAPGQEIAAAENWIRSNPEPKQPWDKTGWRDSSTSEVGRILDPVRAKVLQEKGGHYPAELAILECLYRGVPVPMDAGIDAEIAVFKDLVQRIEARNMIQVLFLGRVEFDRRRRKETLPKQLDAFTASVGKAIADAIAAHGDLGVKAAAFCGIQPGEAAPVWDETPANAIAQRQEQWFLTPQNETEKTALAILASSALAALPYRKDFAQVDWNMADFACIRKAGWPAYLGGPLTFLDQQGEETCKKLAG